MRTGSSMWIFQSLLWSVALFGLFACGESSEPDESAPPPEYGPGGAAVVRVEGELNTATVVLVARAIEEAKASGRNVLVIDLDTPGGNIETMRSLGNLIREASTPDFRTCTWVHPRATSAGVLITLATDKVLMGELGTIGAATPITIGPNGMAPLPEEGGVRAKVMSDMRAQFRDWAQNQGRPGSLAEAMIDSEIEIKRVRIDGEERYLTRLEWSDLRESGAEGQVLGTLSAQGELLSLTAQEAIQTGFADGVAETLEIVLEKVGAGEREPLLVSAKSSEKLLAWLEFATPILIGLALMLAFTEMKMPGFGLPGILALVCFAIAFGGRFFVGLADVPQLVIVTVGFVLVAVELFLMPGTIWFGLSGGLLILAGIIWSLLGPGFALTNALDRRFAFDSAFQLLVTAAVALVVSMFVVRFLPNIPMANRLLTSPREGRAFGDGLPKMGAARAHARVGARGKTLTDLRPVGKVALDGDPTLEFEARSEALALERGTLVVVVEVNGDRLVVEPVPEEKA